MLLIVLALLLLVTGVSLVFALGCFLVRWYSCFVTCLGA